jgi:hypothetical protein
MPGDGVGSGGGGAARRAAGRRGGMPGGGSAGLLGFRVFKGCGGLRVVRFSMAVLCYVVGHGARGALPSVLIVGGVRCGAWRVAWHVAPSVARCPALFPLTPLGTQQASHLPVGVYLKPLAVAKFPVQ